MLDCQLFGMDPWGHHLVNVLLHTLNTMLVFVLIRQLTGSPGLSFFVALFFGWHPFRVESVAWVSERKDVLSGCFGLLALISYVRYARARPGEENPSGMVAASRPLKPWRAARDYWLALLWLALGLLSKPMLVTWPFLFLLLDYWPLARFKAGNLWRLAYEKALFIGLAIVASAITFLVQKQVGAVDMGEPSPLAARCGNALVSYCRYLGKMFWPTDLSIFYPYPSYWPTLTITAAAAFLLGVTILFFWLRRRVPVLLTGWLWFLGALVPTIGLVRVGEQAMADRYTYLPSLGILLLVACGVRQIVDRSRLLLCPALAAGVMAAALCFGLTRQQLDLWRNTETLFGQIMAENHYAEGCNNFGTALLRRDKVAEAIPEFVEAIRIKPFDPQLRVNLANALGRVGRNPEAVSQLREALRLSPDLVPARSALEAAVAKEQTKIPER